MAIYMVGDVHADFSVFSYIAKHVKPEDTVIQVGDFGFYAEPLKTWKHMFPDGFPCRVLAIDGNHEDYRILRSSMATPDVLTPYWTNLYYVPRGTVMEIEGKLFGFLGGACSVDRYWRREEIQWWKDEQVSLDDVARLKANVGDRQLDYLITHQAPSSVIAATFPPLSRTRWGLPDDWEDISAMRIEQAWQELKPKRTLCGHMHRAVLHDNVRILNINEIVRLEDPHVHI